MVDTKENNKTNKESDNTDDTIITDYRKYGIFIILFGFILSIIIAYFTPSVALNTTAVNATAVSASTATAALNATVKANAALNTNAALTSLGLIGFIIFLTVLFGDYLITKKWDFKCGEFRIAITLSVIAVFIGSIYFGNRIFAAPGTFLSTVLSNFWTIVTTVIAFYFASRAIDNKTAKEK